MVWAKTQNFFLILLIAASGMALHISSTHVKSLVRPMRNLEPPLLNLHKVFRDVLTLGQENLYEDFLQVWMIQLLSDTQLVKDNSEKIMKLAHRVAELRPAIESYYLFSCIIIFETIDPKGCEPITIKGLEKFPHSWRIPMMQGFVYHFKLEDYAKAAAMFGLAASRKDSPEYVASLTRKLIQREDISPQAIQEAMNLMLQVPGGHSRFNEVLNQREAP